MERLSDCRDDLLFVWEAEEAFLNHHLIANPDSELARIPDD